MAKITKKDLSAALTKLGVPHDSSASIPALKGLLPAGHELLGETISSNPPQEVDSERKARWDAFLATAREVNPARFDRQKENGEFDEVPDSFK